MIVAGPQFVLDLTLVGGALKSFLAIENQVASKL
jgi:hypothetical protein